MICQSTCQSPHISRALCCGPNCGQVGCATLANGPRGFSRHARYPDHLANLQSSTSSRHLFRTMCVCAPQTWQSELWQPSFASETNLPAFVAAVLTMDIFAHHLEAHPLPHHVASKGKSMTSNQGTRGVKPVCKNRLTPHSCTEFGCLSSSH